MLLPTENARGKIEGPVRNGLVWTASVHFPWSEWWPPIDGFRDGMKVNSFTRYGAEVKGRAAMREFYVRAGVRVPEEWT